MRILALLIFLALLSCSQGSLTEEQRQQLKEEKASRKIQKVAEADILNTAMSQALKIFKTQDPEKVKWVSLEEVSLTPYQKKIQEAYQYSFDKGLKLHHNIEDIGDGVVIFTKPDIRGDTSKGFWMITLDKKEIIKSMQ